MTPILSGAYGRDYKSKAAALKDFNAGVDFRDHVSGRYATRPELEAAGIGVVNIRYRNLRMVLVARNFGPEKGWRVTP